MCTKCGYVLGYTVADVFISSWYVLVYTVVNYMFMQNITELSNPAPAAAPSSAPSSDSSSCQTPASSPPTSSSTLSQNSTARPGPSAPSTILLQHNWLQHNASLALQGNNVTMYRQTPQERSQRQKLVWLDEFHQGQLQVASFSVPLFKCLRELVQRKNAAKMWGGNLILFYFFYFEWKEKGVLTKSKLVLEFVALFTI